MIKIYFYKALIFKMEFLKKDNYLQVSYSIINCDKGEDMPPQNFTNMKNNKQAFMVADGHKGNGCSKVLLNNSKNILELATEKNTIEAINHANNLCKYEDSGAMIIIAVYDPSTYNFEISSIGDCSAHIYQNGKCVHSQPKHNNINDKSLKDYNIDVKSYKQPMYDIDSEGIFHIINSVRNYFKWYDGTEIATSSAIGHYNLKDNTFFKSLPPITTTFNVGKLPFHF